MKHSDTRFVALVILCAFAVIAFVAFAVYGLAT